MQVLNRCYYHYFQYDTGKNLMSKYRENKYEIMRIWYNKILWFTDDINKEEIIDYVNWLDFRYTFSCFIAVMSLGKKYSEKLEYISKILKESKFKPSSSPKYIGKEKFILEKILSSGKVHFIYFVSWMIYIYKSKLKNLYFKTNILEKEKGV